MVSLLLSSVAIALAQGSVSDAGIRFSPYNWFQSTEYAQTANPGAYLKVGFTGTEIAVKVDVTPLSAAKVSAGHYPVVRFSIDGGPAKTVQLRSDMTSIPCAAGLPPGTHNLLLEYVAGYVFLDFWTPVNVLRVTGFTLGQGAVLTQPSGRIAPFRLSALFLGDSITNGDDDIATFARGITNEVDTQDATVGYPAIVSAGIGAEYGVVAYGGASWDGTAADGHTPGIMDFFGKLDSVHSRLVAGKLSPTPDEIYLNMGENSGPSGDDVTKLLTAIRAAASPKTKIFVIVPFSGRSRASLSSGVAAYRSVVPGDAHTFLLDLGNNPYLTDAGPTMLSVDGQHPLATLHAMLAAHLLRARADCLRGR
ncbi:MAG: hypothetical protein P4L46_02550 [Fimbriimonas sp.]|nr:hypothetical protein [Fimbriimonas sp.]